MKKSILLAFYVFSFFLLRGQSTEVVLDTTYNQSKSGLFYTINYVKYSDGSYQERAIALADSNYVLNDYVAKIEARCNVIAEAAVTGMQARQASIDFARMDTLCINLSGRSPVKTLMDIYTSEFSVGQWTIAFSGSTTNVTFPVLSTNKRKRLLPEGTTAKTMLVFGKMMRLTNYPFQGINLLFRVKEGYWANYDKTIVLKRS